MKSLQTQRETSRRQQFKVSRKGPQITAAPKGQLGLTQIFEVEKSLDSSCLPDSA
jgi:hypothetical protein